jgi:calcium-dependent protein kinase
MSGVCTFFYHAFAGCWSNRNGKTIKTNTRSTHTTSVRGNLVKTYKTDINDDYILDVDQELGKGGCGVVVVGEHKELRTQYAIKIVDKSHAERGRLDRELKLLKDVDHTNVVRLFSVYDVPSHMYFVMELCLGGHLGNLLARQPRKYLDETWAKQLALQLLSAVAHIHSRGIAHRDIKLQNILVDQNTNDRAAQLKLIDFGYGSRFVGALPMRTKCGTPYTTAPEVIRECYDERCDVWSCGVVLYIMLCGRRPFEALNCSGTLADAGKAAMITNILAGRYHFNHKAWQTVSKQGLNFVKGLLHPDYKQRMHSHEALENPWLIDTAIQNVHAHVLRSQKSFQAANNIRRMSDVSELHRAGMVALVFGINAKTAADMSTVFQSFDSDASGMLSKAEFSSAMQKIVPELSAPDLNKLFDIIDYDKNNLISYTEFLAATLDPRDLDIGELNKAFRVFDEDGNGYISKDEMRKVRVAPSLVSLYWRLFLTMVCVYLCTGDPNAVRTGAGQPPASAAVPVAAQREQPRHRRRGPRRRGERQGRAHIRRGGRQQRRRHLARRVPLGHDRPGLPPARPRRHANRGRRVRQRYLHVQHETE